MIQLFMQLFDNFDSNDSNGSNDYILFLTNFAKSHSKDNTVRSIFKFRNLKITSSNKYNLINV